MATYLLAYERAASLKTYIHHGKKINLAVDEGVCTRSYVACHLGFSDSQAKSYLATLVRCGLLNKVKKPEINEDVYKVPAITSSDEEFTRIEIQGRVEKIYREGKYLLSTLMFLALDARQSMREEIFTTYNEICRLVGCSRDVARTTMAKLRNLKLVSFEGLRRLGLKLKNLAVRSVNTILTKGSETYEKVSNMVIETKETSTALKKEKTASTPKLPYSRVIVDYLNKRPIKINDSQIIKDFVTELSSKLQDSSYSEEFVGDALDDYLVNNSEAFPVASTIYNHIKCLRLKELAKKEEERRLKEERAAKDERDKEENIIFSCCVAMEKSYEKFKTDGVLPSELSSEERKKIYDHLSHPLGFAKGRYDHGSSDASTRIEDYLGTFSDRTELHRVIRHRWPGYAEYLHRSGEDLDNFLKTSCSLILPKN